MIERKRKLLIISPYFVILCNKTLIKNDLINLAGTTTNYKLKHLEIVNNSIFIYTRLSLNTKYLCFCQFERDYFIISSPLSCRKKIKKMSSAITVDRFFARRSPTCCDETAFALSIRRLRCRTNETISIFRRYPVIYNSPLASDPTKLPGNKTTNRAVRATITRFNYFGTGNLVKKNGYFQRALIRRRDWSGSVISNTVFSYSTCTVKSFYF